MEWTDAGKTTWNEAKRICLADGSRLCTMAELCPAHTPGGRSEAVLRHLTKDDAWVPYADVVDNWVQLGKASDDRTCRTHQQAHGGTNKPCKGDNVDPNNPACGSGNDSVICCSEGNDEGIARTCLAPTGCYLRTWLLAYMCWQYQRDDCMMYVQSRVAS